MVNKGVYVLWLHLPHTAAVTVGKLGTYVFPPGVYAYAGSAQRNLRQRIARHWRLDKKLHWHIDYLRVEAELLGAVLLFNEEKEGECRFVQKLLHLPEACLPVPSFGASDCGCGGHLVYLPSLPPDLVSLGDAIHDIELGPAESLAFFYAGD